MNKLLDHLITYELFGDLEQLELFIRESGSSVLTEELGQLIDSDMLSLGEE